MGREQKRPWMHGRQQIDMGVNTDRNLRVASASDLSPQLGSRLDRFRQAQRKCLLPPSGRPARWAMPRKPRENTGTTTPDVKKARWVRRFSRLKSIPFWLVKSMDALGGTGGHPAGPLAQLAVVETDAGKSSSFLIMGALPCRCGVGRGEQFPGMSVASIGTIRIETSAPFRNSDGWSYLVLAVLLFIIAGAGAVNCLPFPR